jgi:hypothetical protein
LLVSLNSVLLVPTLSKIRLRWAFLAVATLFLNFSPCVAQDDPNETPLGDVARSLRKKVSPDEVVIDNDNFNKVVEDAENRKPTGSTTMVFSLDPSGKNFHVSTPDVSCSLSFTAKAAALISDPLMLDELPREELAKLQGPATLDGDSLQLSIHNGTDWELREVVIGLTIVRTPDTIDASTYYGPAHIVPAVGGSAVSPAPNSNEKPPDSTVLLRVKGSAAPSATAVFRTQLNFALFPDQEWHWAIVRAKGVPPQTPPEPLATTVQSLPMPTESPAVANPPANATAPAGPGAAVVSSLPQQSSQPSH